LFEKKSVVPFHEEMVKKRYRIVHGRDGEREKGWKLAAGPNIGLSGGTETDIH